MSFQGTKTSTLDFIQRRIIEDRYFNGRPNSATIGYTNIIRDLNIPVTERQARSKWQNLVYKYKEMKRYLDGSTKSYRKACSSWPYFKILDEFLTQKFQRKIIDEENFHEGMVNALAVGQFENDMLLNGADGSGAVSSGSGGGMGNGGTGASFGCENGNQNKFEDTSWIKNEVDFDEDDDVVVVQKDDDNSVVYPEQIFNDFDFDANSEYNIYIFYSSFI